ncbi:MarR family winged helix-turn-helix transcriptional regulator [Sabulicella rubraurantiaca]|uniref:MarR family winged helix-turn-helix transcriptional regulator n=1 Tax=Sabulicella rubraurantiaca TaxID=2811429 RepID=UPI001A965C6F|nr:MarR family transcriptional regulator [Sabulicella rubraurantiaca]
MDIALNNEAPHTSVVPSGEGRFVDDYLLYLMARASHAISAEFHATLRRAGIQVPVWRVLASLSGSTTGETVTGLAEACLLQQPTMTKLLDRMVRDGLVKRMPDARDRRVVRIAMTPRGEATVRDLLVSAKAHEAELLSRFPDIGANRLKELLRSMAARPARGRRREAA